MTKRSVAFLALALLGGLPLGAASTSPLVAAAGLGIHTAGGCTAAGSFAVEVDLALGSGVVSGASDCTFYPERYYPGECAQSADGVVRCAYATLTTSSNMTLWADGTFEYRYASGAYAESVTGSLVRT